ncbi:MAG TPA: polysaccharide ABC transporter ATP-binding protein [Acidimicrobiales bacterium]
MTSVPARLPAIELANVSKRYDRLEDQAMLLKSILPFARPKRHELWALRDASFTIEAGETVGILGRNGAGKSTLMRMVAGVTAPTEGVIRTVGRVAPLLSVGVGFHQEMSGRENILVNGMLLGLTRREVTELMDPIIEFSELADFIDTPVKFYSSGMYMRLGFSVAIHVRPQILLLDEVLAVGDIAFQLKCFDRMRDLQRGGATIVMVSHSMHAIRLLCPRVLLFRKGVLEFDGDAEPAISRHHQFLVLDSEADHIGARQMPVTVFDRVMTRDGVETAASAQEDELEITWTLRFEETVTSPHAVFRILAEDGTLGYSMHTYWGTEWRDFKEGDVTTVRVRFSPRFGGGGTFRLMLDITDTIGAKVLGGDSEGLRLYVTTRLGTGGLGDAQADMWFDDEPLNDWQSITFEDARTAPEPDQSLTSTHLPAESS